MSKSRRPLEQQRQVEVLAPSVRGRMWVDWGGITAVTDAGADLLEQIQVCGSLSEAARRLKFSYRRAWLLAHTMNRRCPMPVLTLTTGGRRGGGAQVTDFGRALVAAYRDVQIQLEHFLGQATNALSGSVRK